MPEGSVPQVVTERHGLDEVFVQAQRARYRAGYLGYFERVCETDSDMVGALPYIDLGFIFKPPERL